MAEIFEEDRLRSLDAALHESAVARGVSFVDDSAGELPRLEGPLPTDARPLEIVLRLRDLESKVGELPELIRWIAYADYRFEEDTVRVVAGRVDLGTWTDAEFNEVLRRYRNAAGG
jgi:hypothetical protein